MIKIFGKPFGTIGSEMPIQGVHVDQRVTSYGQSGGITAHTVNVGQQQRRISPERQARMVSILSRSGGGTINIFMHTASDGGALRADILKVCRDAGWTLAFDGQAFGGGGDGPPSGILVVMKDPINPTPCQRIFMEAMSACGLPWTATDGDMSLISEADISLHICERLAP